MPKSSPDDRSADEPLLAPAEPPACAWHNRDGAAPMLLLCDHASPRIPEKLGRLGLAPERLREHIAWDIGCADVAERLAQRFDAPLLLSGYSRLVIDLNRFPHHPASIPEVSDGVPIPGNRGLTRAEVERRVDTLFRPYHDAVAARLAAFATRGVSPCLLSVHSFTPRIDGDDRPWQIGVLWNRDGRLALPLIERLRREPGLCVGDNQPYSATSPLGYTMATHAEGGGHPHFLLEIRQDLIAEPAGAARWASRLGDALADVLTPRS